MATKAKRKTAEEKAANGCESVVSIRQFGRIVNCSHTQILRLIQKGIIPQDESGGVPIPSAVDAFNAYQVQKKKGKANTDGASEHDLDMMNAELLLAESKARLRELEYKVKTGVLLKSEDVARVAAQTATDLKAKLFAIPARLASLCEGRSAAEIEKMIAQEIEPMIDKAFAKNNQEIEALAQCGTGDNIDAQASED